MRPFTQTRRQFLSQTTALGVAGALDSPASQTAPQPDGCETLLTCGGRLAGDSKPHRSVHKEPRQGKGCTFAGGNHFLSTRDPARLA